MQSIFKSIARKCRSNLAILICMGIWAFSSTMSAQNTRINLTLRTDINLDLTEIFQAGAHNEVILDDSQWLNYSCKLDQNEPYKSITVALSSGTIPTGTEVYLEASEDIGNGWGNPGIPTGKIKLSTIPTLIVTQIGNCNTGNGKLKGHRITLSFQVSNFALLQPENQTIYLLYTLQ